MQRITCILATAGLMACAVAVADHALAAAGPFTSARPTTPATSAPVPVRTTPASKVAPDRFRAATVPGRMEPPIRLWAPVPPPYSNSAYHDLGGQPETGEDVLDSQAGHGH